MDGVGQFGRSGTARAMECQVCRKGEAPEGQNCPYCGAIVRSVLGRGGPIPPEVVAEAEERSRALKLRREASIRERSKNSAVIGAVIFALCGCGLVGATICSLVAHEIVETVLGAKAEVRSTDAAVDNPPANTVPPSIVLRFLLVLPLAAILGAPSGYAIGRLDRGLGFSILMGAGAFSLATVLLVLGGILSSSHPLLELALCAAIGSVPGAGAGCLLGLHITSERP